MAEKLVRARGDDEEWRKKSGERARTTRNGRERIRNGRDRTGNGRERTGNDLVRTGNDLISRRNRSRTISNDPISSRKCTRMTPDGAVRTEEGAGTTRSSV